MNHLEKLIRQFHEWQGYIVRGNVKVGRLKHGGWAGELDIIAYHPETQHLIHLEPSIDADNWNRREERFLKKFTLGKQYIRKEVLPWLPEDCELEQIAVLVSGTRTEIGGGKVVSVDDYMSGIRKRILQEGVMRKAAIPEEFDLLRTIQLTICGYNRRVLSLS